LQSRRFFVEGIVRLYPFITKDRNPDASRTVAVDPTVAFGKPVIAGTGIPIAAIISSSMQAMRFGR
jgi:uncharacterized protein (DUF433 family)